MSPSILILLSTTLPAAPLDAEFHCQFSDSAAVDELFQPFGPNLADSLLPQSDGLIIDLPESRSAAGPVGIAPRFEVVGDFEITLAYEVVHAATPAAGTGAGVKMWGQIGGKTGQTVSLGHLLRTQHREDAVLTFKRGGQDGKLVYKALPVKQRQGRLRMTRTGDEMAFAHAGGDSEDFQEIHRVVKVRTEPLKNLRLSAQTGGDPAGLTVKLVDLQVQAEAIGRPQDAAARSNGWLAAVLILLVVVAAVGGGLGYGVYRQRKLSEGQDE